MPLFTDNNEVAEAVNKSEKINNRSYEYYETHFDRLQDNHGGEIVAIVNSHVEESIEETNDPARLEAFVNSVRAEHGDEAFITHIPEADRTLLL